MTLACLALLIEALVGYPDWLASAIGHPVIWVGRLIDILDRLLNRDTDSRATRRAGGILAVIVIVGTAAGVAWLLEHVLLAWPLGIIAAAIVASTLIAQRSLHQHVARVATALEHGGLAAGREAVSHIVGRDTAELDEAGVARAAIESLAEK